MVLALMLGIFVSGEVFAQVTDIPITDQITLNKVYAGTLSWSTVSIDSLNATNTAGIRFGAQATWRPSQYFAMCSMAAYEGQSGNTSWSMNQFAFIINPTKRLTITSGNVCTLVTEQRPSPITGAGQFETWTQSRIPGMALVAKASYELADKTFVGFAVARRNNKPEYQANFSLRKFTVSAYYDEWNKKYASVLTFKAGRLNEIIVWKQDELIANTTTFDLGKGKDYCLYSDIGYDLANKKLLRGEWGVLKTFSTPYFEGLIGPGYCYEDRSLHFYLYAHFPTIAWKDLLPHLRKDLGYQKP